MNTSSFSSRTQQLYLLKKLTQDYQTQEKAFRQTVMDEHNWQRTSYLLEGIKMILDSCSSGQQQQAEECLQDLRHQYPSANLLEVERLCQLTF